VSTLVGNFDAASVFLEKAMCFPAILQTSTVLLGGATVFDEIGENFEKFSKSEGKVCAHDYGHLRAVYS